MKKWIIINVIVICSLSILTIFINSKTKEINLDNNKLYKYFEDKQVINTNKKIDLSSVREEHKEITKEVKELFEDDKIDIELYLNKIEEEKNKNIELKKETEEMSAKVEELSNKKETLSKQYETLKNKYNSLIAQRNSNSTGFPLINQYPNYPTGCESVALTMLLKYYGVSVTPNNIINNLNKESLPYYENNVLYGGNPEIGFLGNPYSNQAYGTYEVPIKNVASIYKGGILGGSGIPFNDVVTKANSGHPVQVWVSMGLSVPYISQTWIYKPTMEQISWKSGEHSVVVISANDSTVKIADPIGGTIREYSRSLFENRYDYFGRKAVYY